MCNMVECEGKVAFHPGCYIEEIIEDMGIGQDKFAARLGVTTEMLDDLIRGRCGVNEEVAKKLAGMLGTSVEVWVRLQGEYEKKIKK